MSTSTAVLELSFVLKNESTIKANIDIRNDVGIIIAQGSKGKNKHEPEKIQKYESYILGPEVSRQILDSLRPDTAAQFFSILENKFTSESEEMNSPPRKRKFGQLRLQSKTNKDNKVVTSLVTCESHDWELFEKCKMENDFLNDYCPTGRLKVLKNGSRQLEIRNKVPFKSRRCPIISPKTHDSSSGYGVGTYVYTFNSGLWFSCRSGSCKNKKHFLAKLCDKE